MYRSATALSILALAAFGPQSGRRFVAPALQLKEERFVMEYVPAVDCAVLIMAAEAEEHLERIEIREPRGAPILLMDAEASRNLSLSGFVLETRESSHAAIVRDFSEGIYDLRARTPEGHRVLGSAVLSHELLREPTVLHPVQGARAPANG